MTAVEAYGVSHKEPSHYLGKVDKSGSEKKMIRDEHPCVTAGFGLWQEFRKALQEILTVPFVHEDFSTLYPRIMMWCKTPGAPRRACLSMGHYYISSGSPVNLLFYQRPSSHSSHITKKFFTSMC